MDQEQNNKSFYFVHTFAYMEHCNIKFLDYCRGEGHGVVVKQAVQVRGISVLDAVTWGSI